MQGGSRGICHNLGPKHWKSNMPFKSTTRFSFLLSVMVGKSFFFFFFHIIHTIQKEILQYMVIPKFCSRSHLFHHVYLACFPILHKMEINSVSGRSFIFQTKTKTKNLLKQIPAFHRTPGFPGFAILKTKISKTALKQAGLL